MATHGRWRGSGRGVVVVQWFYAGCGSKSSFRLPSGRSEFTHGSGVSQWLHSLGGWGGGGGRPGGGGSSSVVLHICNLQSSFLLQLRGLEV